ncbi:DinB family protein [Zobellia alginiliquefaciens]|uniref:DinB family protein n=1 Tax=Zobellia alginiliquefaciens TaxID=3032586 RepID=UPI0023E43A8B|nr:DinB family protein [Zobellia alginiliquefaciens]
MNTANPSKEKVEQIILPEELLTHWQGHRALTRKTIENFPEKEFFEYSIGGMRTYAEIVQELLSIAGPGTKEIVTGVTSAQNENIAHGNSKQKVLELWDEATREINENWSKIDVGRFHDEIKSFGLYEGTVQSAILYFIDNEIHHRGQGYVYLRSLGIEPPMFWDRGDI